MCSYLSRVYVIVLSLNGDFFNFQLHICLCCLDKGHTTEFIFLSKAALFRKLFSYTQNVHPSPVATSQTTSRVRMTANAAMIQ